MQAIICYHVFKDGNKRTGVMSAYTFLEHNGYLLETDPDEMYRMALKTADQKAQGISDEEMLAEISEWLRKNSSILN